MNIIFLCGSHPRHRYIANKLNDCGYLSGLVIEERGPHIPETPSDLGRPLTELYEEHFNRRAIAEKSFFGDQPFPSVASLNVAHKDLNSIKVHNFLSKMQPDLCISYGVHLISNKTLSFMGCDVWNIHGGLSPEYKGVITHFWPSYMLEPQMTGVTLHEISSKIDAGKIVHQTSADLVRGDGLHQLACRVVKKFSNELISVLRMKENGELKPSKKQTRTGKLWLNKDWRPEHLRLIYELYSDSIVDFYIDGELNQFEPKLIRQF